MSCVTCDRLPVTNARATEHPPGNSPNISLKFNQEESPLFDLIGVGPQRSWAGQNFNIISSDDNSEFVTQEDQY